MTARRPPRTSTGASRPAGGPGRQQQSNDRPGGNGSRGRVAASRSTGSARPSTAPSAGPARSSKKDDGSGDSPAPTITLRGLGLFVVLLVAFIVLAPTLRHAVEQQEQLRLLSVDLEDTQQRNAELELELEQWQDPTFVQAQARDRLGYVMPGEQTFRVVDPESVVGPEAEVEAEDSGVVSALAAPWYVSLWESVTIAGEASPGEPDPDPSSG